MPGAPASSYASKMDKILSKVEFDTNGGCWLWRDAPNTWGYGMFNWDAKVYAAHRVSFEEVNGPLASGVSVLHRCDTPACVNPDHLFAGSHRDNMRDMHAKGRWADHTGEKHHRAKLTDAQALEIKRRYAANKGAPALAAEFGVSQSTIYAIGNGQNFTHLEIN